MGLWAANRKPGHTHLTVGPTVRSSGSENPAPNTECQTSQRSGGIAAGDGEKPVATEIDAALFVEANSLLQETLPLVLRAHAGPWTDFTPCIDDSVPRHIGIGLKAGHGIAHHPGRALPGQPGHLPVCGHPTMGNLADRRVNPFPGGLARCPHARSHRYCSVSDMAAGLLKAFGRRTAAATCTLEPKGVRFRRSRAAAPADSRSRPTALQALGRTVFPTM